MGHNRNENLDQLLSLQSPQSVARSKKLKEAAELRDGGATAILIRYRNHLQKGFKLVANDIRKQRNGSKKKLKGTAQMENCVKLLMKNEIDREAIRSVLHYAYEFRLFGYGHTVTPAEGDTGHLGYQGTTSNATSSTIEEEQKKEVEMMPDLEVLPEWFRGYTPSEVERAEIQKRWIFKKKKKKKLDIDPRHSLSPKRSVVVSPSWKSQRESLMEDVPMGFWVDPTTGRRVTFDEKYVLPISDSDEEQRSGPLPQMTVALTGSNQSRAVDQELEGKSTRLRPGVHSNIDSDSETGFDPIEMQLDEWAAGKVGP